MRQKVITITIANVKSIPLQTLATKFNFVEFDTTRTRTGFSSKGETGDYSSVRSTKSQAGRWENHYE